MVVVLAGRLVFLLALSLFIGALLTIAVFRLLRFRPISALTLPYFMNRTDINALDLVVGWFEETKPISQSQRATTPTPSQFSTSKATSIHPSTDDDRLGFNVCIWCKVAWMLVLLYSESRKTACCHFLFNWVIFPHFI